MRNDFIEKTGLNFPKLPINIRWGQWILFMNFIMMHYDVIRRYFEDKTDGKHLFDILSHSDFKNKLCEIYEFKDLPKLITCLEKEGLKVSEQINIVFNFRNTISKINIFRILIRYGRLILAWNFLKILMKMNVMRMIDAICMPHYHQFGLRDRLVDIGIFSMI